MANEIKVVAPPFSSDEFDAIIEINSTTPLAGAQCNFLFNGSILNVTYVKNGGMFELWGGNFSDIPIIDNKNGTIKDIVAFSINNTATHGKFAIIHFKAMEEGISYLNIENALLSDENASKVEANVTNASIIIDFTPPKIENVSINVPDGYANISCNILEPYLKYAKINLTYPDGEKKEFYMDGSNPYFFNHYFSSGNYSFFIIAKDKAGNTVSSPSYNFLIGKNNPPVKPYSPFPENGSIVPIDINLSWECNDPDGDNITYDVYFGMNESMQKIASNITSNFCHPGTLQYSSTYYWRVIAWDAHKAKNESVIWHFHTQNPPNQPPTIEITMPQNNTTVNGTITIKGTASDDKQVVKVEVRIDNNAWYHAVGTTSWSYSIDTTTLNNGKHIIEARSYDGSLYSNIASIIINVFNNHKPNVAIVEPENGSIVSKTITIKGKAWDEDGNESIVKVEIRIDGGKWNDAIGTTSWKYILNTTLLNNGMHVIEARSDDGFDYGHDSIEINVNNEQIRKYALTAYSSPINAGYVTPAGGTYDEGSMITITAHAYSGYEFDHWGGDASGSNPTIQITMNSDKNIIAYFIPIESKPNIDFSYDPSLPFSGETVHFYGKGDATLWHWQFGDGSAADEKNPTHVYKKAGRYNVILEATINGKKYEKARVIEVRGKEKADFIFSPIHPSPGMVIHFYGKGENITKYEWNFGDGSLSYGKNVSHVYTAGNYTIILHIVDKWGNEDNKSVEMMVQYPDFIVKNLKYENGMAKAIISNLGGDAKNVSVAFYLNENKIKETKANLSHGKDVEIEEEMPHEKGKNEIKVVVDPQNDFKEENEENNAFAMVIGKDAFPFSIPFLPLALVIALASLAFSYVLLHKKSKRKEKIPIADEKQELRCVVCFGKFKPNAEIVRCECGAVFHKSCAERVKTCPICGRKLV